MESDKELLTSHSNDLFYHTVVEASPNAMVVVDRQGRIALANAQAERLFGAPRKALIGMPVESLVPERFRANHPESRARFFANPQARAMGMGRDLYALRRDGTEFPVEIGLNPVKTNRGTMVLAAIIDITERKRLESHFRQVVESVPNGIIVVDGEGRISLLNRQVELMFGIPRVELAGRPVEVLLPERYRDGHPGSRASFLRNPEARAMGVGRDLYAMRRDGSEFPVEIGLSPIRTVEGTMVLAAIVDITERKHAEQALRESEENFRLLVDGVKDYAIFMIDPDGRVQSWNSGAEGIKGYRSEEVIGQPMAIFYPEEEVEAGVPEKHLRIARESGRYEDDVIRVRKDGSRFWASVVLTALHDEHGRLQGYVKVTRDITERRRAQESMAQALEEKTTLLNEIHHRVKNNLQVISSLFNLQAAHSRDEAVQQVLSESQGRIRAMALIHQLLYERRNFSGINLGEYLERLGQLLLTVHSSVAKRISVRTEIEGESVCLDLNRAIACGLMVTELVTNAFKHGFPDKRMGEVRIRLLGTCSEEATLTVCDTGIGLPENFAIERSTSLGLRLVQRLAGQVKGRFVVGEGPGASFSLHFTPMNEDKEQ